MKEINHQGPISVFNFIFAVQGALLADVQFSISDAGVIFSQARCRSDASFQFLKCDAQSLKKVATAKTWDDESHFNLFFFFNEINNVDDNDDPKCLK